MSAYDVEEGKNPQNDIDSRSITALFFAELVRQLVEDEVLENVGDGGRVLNGDTFWQASSATAE